MARHQKAPEPSPPKKNQSRSTIVVAGAAVLILVLIALFTLPRRNEPMPSPVTPTSTTQAGVYEFLKQGQVRFLTAKQDFIAAIDVELAEDDLKRTQGLMFRDKLGEDQGMLFVFEDEATRSFWMKNTVLPLDMIFVNGRNEIVTIHKNTTPYSEQSYESTKPAKYVIEVNAGYADRHKVAVGDRISWNRM